MKLLCCKNLLDDFKYFHPDVICVMMNSLFISKLSMILQRREYSI